MVDFNSIMNIANTVLPLITGGSSSSEAGETQGTGTSGDNTMGLVKAGLDLLKGLTGNSNEARTSTGSADWEMYNRGVQDGMNTVYNNLLNAAAELELQGRGIENLLNGSFNFDNNV